MYYFCSTVHYTDSHRQAILERVSLIGTNCRQALGFRIQRHLAI
uniref:Uncharacterized protein n=1 Tax=Cane toad associated toti-like virus 2 TaxID=2859899 RepID=A0A8F6YI02_9VIRU|nr:hypothetical protein [Cane toad associated toti-like virus 2]